MVSNFNKYSAIIFSTLILISCETENLIEYKYSAYEKKLVVQGFISNEGITVNISRSLPAMTLFSDSIDISVNGVKVILFINNEPAFELNEIEPGLYHSPDTFSPKLNTAYHILVSAPGYKTAISSNQYLTAPLILDSCFIFKKDLFHYLNITFCDQDTAKNFFYFSRYIFHNGNEDAESFFNPSNEIYPLFDPGRIIYDDNFNGSSNMITDQFYASYWNYSDTIWADSIKISLYSLSGDIVKYLETLNAFDYARDDMWLEYPVSIFSNIMNGFGILGTYNRIDRILKIQKQGY